MGAGEEDLIFEYLNLLVSRPDVAQALGERARDYVAEECNWAAVARQYADFLERRWWKGAEWASRSRRAAGSRQPPPQSAGRAAATRDYLRRLGRQRGIARAIWIRTRRAW